MLPNVILVKLCLHSTYTFSLIFLSKQQFRCVYIDVSTFMTVWEELSYGIHCSSIKLEENDGWWFDLTEIWLPIFTSVIILFAHRSPLQSRKWKQMRTAVRTHLMYRIWYEKFSSFSSPHIKTKFQTEVNSQKDTKFITLQISPMEIVQWIVHVEISY